MEAMISTSIYKVRHDVHVRVHSSSSWMSLLSVSYSSFYFPKHYTFHFHISIHKIFPRFISFFQWLMLKHLFMHLSHLDLTIVTAFSLVYLNQLLIHFVQNTAARIFTTTRTFDHITHYTHHYIGFLHMPDLTSSLLWFLGSKKKSGSGSGAVILTLS